MPLDFQGVLKKQFVQSLVEQTCGPEPDIIERPAAFILRNPKEGLQQSVHRLIILPAHGYTANSLNEANSHDEVQRATIQVKGSVKDGKNGFSVVKDCLLVVSFQDNKGVSTLNEPYLTYELGKTQRLKEQFHSAGTAPFEVVKPNGFGFYHNLINTTDEWLLLKLKKVLRPSKTVDLSPQLLTASKAEAALIKNLYENIVKQGDGVFSELKPMIDSVTKLPPKIILPALGEMLFVHDTGRHEACTAFALILKIGRKHPIETMDFLKQASFQQSIPVYYANQLLKKLDLANENDNPEPRMDLIS